ADAKDKTSSNESTVLARASTEYGLPRCHRARKLDHQIIARSAPDEAISATEDSADDHGCRRAEERDHPNETRWQTAMRRSPRRTPKPTAESPAGPRSLPRSRL